MLKISSAFARISKARDFGGSIKRDLIVGLTGRMYSALIGIAVTPIYVRLLGLDGYGLVGMFTTLSMVAALLDAGMSTTLNRELSRLRSRADSAQDMRDTLTTIEAPYWLATGVVAVLIWFASDGIARYWVQGGTLPASRIATCIALMGATIALQLPTGLYSGGILAIQRMTDLTIMSALAVTAKHVGSLLILNAISTSPEAFFGWQMSCTALLALAVRITLRTRMPKALERGVFRMDLLIRLWRFAAGMSFIAVLSTVIQNTDKIVLTKTLPLQEVGLYSLCVVVTSSTSLVTTAMYNAMFSRFAWLAELGDCRKLTELYHRSCQTLTAMVLPVAAVIITFAPQILLVWTHDVNISETAAPSLRFLMAGAALNSLVYMPYTLIIGSGKARLVVAVYVTALLILIPATIYATVYHGLVGASIVNCLFHLGSLVALVPLVEIFILKQSLKRWAVEDVLKPGIPAVIVPIGSLWLAPAGSAAVSWLLFIAAVLGVTVLCAMRLIPWIWDGSVGSRHGEA